jgi:hypothetical protein
MAEAFLLLLAAGVMLAVAVPDPRDVTLNWLRLGGIIALALIGLSWYFGRDTHVVGRVLRYRHAGMAVLVLGQLGFAQSAWRKSQRVVALTAFLAGCWLVTKTFELTKAISVQELPHPGYVLRVRMADVLTNAGVAAMTGLVLMAMLLGHAYLTASRVTMRPFRRLSTWLIGVMILRILCAAGLTMLLQWRRPIAGLWPVHGFLIVTRWVVGLLVPFVFALMAHECIGRRATQSATGILYVAGVLVFIGELIGLNVAWQTGLPF